MKQLFVVNDSRENRITYYHLALFLVALPFDYFYSELILISFGLHTFIHLKKENLRNIMSGPVLIPSSIFLLGLLALSYSPDKQEGINVLTRQLAILLFPVLFALTGIDLKKYRINLVCIFGFTCTLTILYLYADAVRTIFYFHLPISSLFTLVFMNQNFSLPIQIHATYLSAYAAFSLLSFIYLLAKKECPANKWIFIFSALVLCTGLIQLSSRSVFIAFLLIVNLVFPFFLFQGKRRFVFFLGVSLISAITLLVITEVDSFKTRYISELKTDLSGKERIIDNTEPRLARWNAIMELVEKSPFIGYGTGSQKNMLKEKYFEKGLFFSYLNEFNAHNEYLSVVIKTGLVGLAAFILLLLYGLYTAVVYRDVVFISFMIIVCIVCISENFMELNKGVFFYSFFFSFFLWSSRVRVGLFHKS